MAQVGQKSETWKQKRANMRASVSMRVRVRACACASACACARAQPNGDAARRGPRRGRERTPQPCVRRRQSRNPRPRPRRRAASCSSPPARFPRDIRRRRNSRRLSSDSLVIPPHAAKPNPVVRRANTHVSPRVREHGARAAPSAAMFTRARLAACLSAFKAI